MPEFKISRAEQSCPFNQCDGSGFIYDEETRTASDCQCRKQRISRRKARSLSGVIPKRYQGVALERPPISQLDGSVLRVAREYLDNIAANIEDGKGLWLTGPNGTGKTSLAMLISKTALSLGYSVAIYSVPRLLAEIRETYQDSSQRSYLELLNRLATVDLLHLDDLGAEKTSEWVLEQLYAIINDRYENQQPVIITTNLAADDLTEQITERTVSRIFELCGDPIHLGGPDMRVTINPELLTDYPELEQTG